jgi:hypothetical protein
MLNNKKVEEICPAHRWMNHNGTRLTSSHDSYEFLDECTIFTVYYYFKFIMLWKINNCSTWRGILILTWVTAKPPDY